MRYEIPNETEGKETRNMTATLTQRISAYERKNAIADDMSLLLALREILAAEEEKPDCDWDVVCEATDAILSLEGKYPASFEADEADAAALREKAASAPAVPTESDAPDDDGSIRRLTLERKDVRTARASKKIRRILPIAAVLAALLIGGAVAGAKLLDVFSMDSDTYKNLPTGTVISADGEDLEKSDARTKQSGYDSLTGEKYAALLVPSPLPDGWSVRTVITDELTNSSIVETYIDAGEGKTVRIKAQLGLGRQSASPTERIGAYDVFVSAYDGVTQGEFAVGEDYYLIQASDRETLVGTIECMEARK